MMNDPRIATSLTALFAASAFLACDEQVVSDAGLIEAALELENGGLDSTDEAPAFGDADLFSSLADAETGEAIPTRARGAWLTADGHEFGHFHGLIRDAVGARVGYVRGVWGQRQQGERVFFGKVIDIAGRFRGILGGDYLDGELVGNWVRGACQGEDVEGGYGHSVAHPELGVGFVLRWEGSCL